MNYKKIFQSEEATSVGLIGTGAFGQSFLVQSQLIVNLNLAVVCDKSIETAISACLKTGMKADDLSVCHTRSDAKIAMTAGKTAVVSDPGLLMELPIEVVVEATGMPEDGAFHARLAIENGMHVVMASKETDCVVGPILNRMAQHTGLVYAPADGDQPALLIDLISWAETLGLEIVCAGKASELDFVFDPGSRTFTRGSQAVAAADEDLWQLPDGACHQGIKRRRMSLESLPRSSVADLCEMAIVINATGYDYDVPGLHAPIARIVEMPEILCSHAAGGIFEKEGVIDIVNCLRRPDEVSFAGGVFVMVKCRGRETWQFLKDKGHLVSRDGNRAMIFRPYHLLGVETAISVLAASQPGLSSTGIDLRPRVELGIRAGRTLQAGVRLEMDNAHSIAGVIPEILEAKKMAAENPIPYYMAAGRRLKDSVGEGQLITFGMVDLDLQSCLWKLRQKQDAVFF